MADLRDLYQEVILEHSKAPRNFASCRRRITRPKASIRFAATTSPCILTLEGGSIRDVTFQGAGCAISKASASMMTQSVKGKSKEEAGKIFESFKPGDRAR